jgi:hypothetical protein
LLAFLLRLLLWAIALALVLIWLTGAAAVWVVEALVAWRRKTAMPSFHVPRAPSDAKFGRTAAAAAVLVIVLLLLGAGSEDSENAQPVVADSSSLTTKARLTASPDSQVAAETAGATSQSKRRSEERARVRRRAAEARARRRAASRAAQARARPRAASRAAKARAAQRQRCDPNYQGACLDPDARDYDCEGGSGDGPKYTGTVRVVGSDPYDLDRDGDGTGCDP